MSTPAVPVIHVAGHPMGIGPLHRQRCAWCGAIMLDIDARKLAPTDPLTPWNAGTLVLFDGERPEVVGYLEDVPRLHASACAFDEAVAAGMLLGSLQ